MTLLGKELLPILTPDMNTQPTLWLRVAQYGMAVALTLATCFLREHIAVSFGQRPLLILFMLPIIISALLGGLGSGLLATLTAGLCTALLIPPADSLAIAASYDILQWGMLLINGILVSLLSGSLHHIRRQELRKWQQLDAVRQELQQSQAFLISAFEEAGVGMALVALDGHWLKVNPKLCDILGYSAEELLGQTFQDITHPDDLASDQQNMAQLLAGDIQTYTIEKRYIRPSQRLLWVNLTVVLARHPNGLGNYFVCVIEDIQARKQAELALFASEHNYRSLFDNMLNGYAYCRMVYDNGHPCDFMYLNVNKAFTHLTGLSNVLGRKVSEVIPTLHKTSPELLTAFNRVALGAPPECFESYVETLKIWFSLSVYSPQREHFVVIFDVITERKQAELALRQNEAFKRAILDSVNAQIAVLDLQGIIVAANRPWLQFAETSRLLPEKPIKYGQIGDDYLAACRQGTAYYQECTPKILGGIQAVLDGHINYCHFECPFGSNPEQHWFSVTVTPLGDARQGVVITHTDISERKQAEAALNQLTDDLSSTLQAIPDLLFEIDETGRYIKVKATQEKLLIAPPSHLLGRTVNDVLPPEAAQTVLQALASAAQTGFDYGRTITLPLMDAEHCFELSVARKSGHGGQPQQFVVLSRDITERKAAEASLQQKTQELLERNTELQRFNDAMVGRELDMIALKQQVNAFASQLGQDPPYPLAFLALPEFQEPYRK